MGHADSRGGMLAARGATVPAIVIQLVVSVGGARGRLRKVGLEEAPPSGDHRTPCGRMSPISNAERVTGEVNLNSIVKHEITGSSIITLCVYCLHCIRGKRTHISTF